MLEYVTTYDAINDLGNSQGPFSFCTGFARFTAAKSFADQWVIVLAHQCDPLPSGTMIMTVYV